jgi:lysophospholipase L1-like esterase
VVVAMLIVEIAIRMTSRYHTPATRRQANLHYEPAIFARHVLRRGQEFRKKGHELRINSLGYRGEDFPISKPDGVTRLIFVGGSFVFTWPPKTNIDWPAWVGERLTGMGLDGVQVINAGIAGHCSADSVGRLVTEIWRFEPDYVIIVNAWNDMKYFHHFIENQSILRSLKPLQQKLDPRLFYRNPVDEFLSEHSQLFVRIRRKYYDITFPADEEGRVHESPALDFIPSEGIEQYRINLLMFAEAARNIGATPVFITQPTLVTMNTSMKKRKKIKYRSVRMGHELLVEAFRKCRDVMLEVAQSKQADSIDLYSDLLDRHELFRDHVHMTEDGYTEVADIVSVKLYKVITGNDPGGMLEAGGESTYEPVPAGAADTGP